MSNAKGCIALLCLPLKKQKNNPQKPQAIQMTFLSYSDSPHCGALISRTAEHSPLHISTNPFSPKTLFSRLFWVPLQVYSMFALFTKVAEPEVFYLCQFLLSISTNTYLKVSTRVLSHCCCAVTGKHRVTEHDDLSVSLD